MKIPGIGFGTWQITNEEATNIVSTALDAGHRLIDTASMYNNEEGIGKAIQESSLKRDEVFLATKVWNADQGYDATLRAIDSSLKRLNTPFVDLYMIHWPAPKLNKFLPTWKALMRLHKEGLAKSIGVCNFSISNLQLLIDETGIVPAINQIELHPYFQQKELRDFHLKHGIITEAWSPIARGNILQDNEILKLATKYEHTPAQIILRWHFENGIIAIPKSSNTLRIIENLNIFNFSLSKEDLEVFKNLDQEYGRIGPNPDTADF
jgi:2,5-diketo-D-gluconate reductase A